jgi:hypothetical protein
MKIAFSKKARGKKSHELVILATIGFSITWVHEDKKQSWGGRKHFTNRDKGRL